MDELEIQGKIYISSKRAHDLTGYAKDYVGQLARGGKLPATRVGRAWYVEQSALLALTGPVETATEPEARNAILGDLPVPEAAQTIASLQLLDTTLRARPVLNTWSSIRYVSDSRDLLPPVIEVKPTIEESTKPITINRPLQSRKTAVVARPRPASRFSDGIIPAEPVKVQKVERVSLKELEREPMQIGAAQIVGATFALTAVVVVAAMAISMNSTWSVESNQAAVGAMYAGIFDQGIELIHSSLSLFLGSFSSFFNIGLQFIVHILNLG